jgi:poly-beta-1,6-N-acetyl-D-glucosamine synthase
MPVFALFLELIFFTSALLLVYHYFAYPAIVWLLARRLPPSVPAAAGQGEPPSLSFVIAAFNEERVIERKLENTLALTYPAGRVEVIVAAHGSSDATVEIARRFQSRGVRTLHDPERRGKTAALNRALEAATGEVVVFSDANNDFDSDALLQLVRHFADPEVGGVCGLKQIYSATDRESAVGDGLYWRYESAIKTAESRLGSITTADGEIFAIRRALYEPLDEAIVNDDAAITFSLIRQGRRVLYEPAARSFEQASITIEDDFNVKVRMVSGGFQTLKLQWRRLLPPRDAFALAFLSHKVLRWLAPELMLILLLISILLSRNSFFLTALVAQLSFYAIAWLGWTLRRRGPLPTWIYVPFYFCTMNAAAFMGLYRYLSRSMVWKKAQR